MRRQVHHALPIRDGDQLQMPLELHTAVPVHTVSDPGQQPSSFLPSQFSSVSLPQISCSGARPPAQVVAQALFSQV